MTKAASSPPTTPAPRRQQPAHPGYPGKHCTCAEGRIVSGTHITWLPPVHDCAYIKERNRKLFGQREERTTR